jgi:hypothetical protein
MIFGTKAEWEDTDPVTQVVHSPYCIFDTFEIMIFDIFYILEVKFEAEDGVILGRLFFIENLERVLEILNEPKTKRHRLSVFVPQRYNQSGSCSTHRVKKIYQGIKKEHWGIYIFECTDRTVNRNDLAKSLSENDVICVYPLMSGGRKRRTDSELDRKGR